ncbi:MAG: metallophosphoesterase [Bacillota bacterium]|jgi:predicted phosphohydrolase|nr:metallophosphoesterase [Bacillota bacterium]HHU43159.1 serine/threonine protein phosphatase [Clostridiales bacterium]
MRIFAISDLHISFSTDKPMDIFGENWQNHFDKITADWQERVSDEDLVLIAGDTSWAMTLDEAKKDFEKLSELKGKKVIIRGNHDYWWTGYSKVKKALPANIFAIQNNALKFGEYIICGTRGWIVPEKQSELEDNEKYINRESIRLRMSLESAKKLRDKDKKIIVMTHFPPFNSKFEDSPFTEIISEYDVDLAIYGHLHGQNLRKEIVNKGKTNYYLTSCDYLEFKLLELTQKI